jgi:ABC-type transport system substrate-binding protein
VAFTQAVDRAAVVANVFGASARVAVGPFTRAQPTADTTLRQPAYDTAAAGRAFDALGWRLDPARGVRARGGRPLAVSLLVPATSAQRTRLAVLLQAQLARVGVRVDVDAVDAGAYMERMRAGDFDLALNLYRADPSPVALRQAWGTPRGADVGANVGRWSHAGFDAALDSAAGEFAPGRRRALVRRAYQIALDEAPAVWLYEPRNVAAVRRDLRPAAMRADAWWAGLADWRLAGDAGGPGGGPAVVAAAR